jgi:predicted nucleic acid-binding protein
MRVLLDVNVILDSMLQRKPWHVETDAIFQVAALGKLSCATTPLSLATVYYVGRRVVGTTQARADIRNFVKALEIVPMTRQTLIDADALAGKDFEDDLQIAAAVAATVDAVVTRDASGFSHSPIPVWTPTELLQRLQNASPPPVAHPNP